jgi:hypothetical protein
VNHVLFLLGLAGAVSLTPQALSSRSTLQRVQPPAASTSAQDPFDAEHWRERLTTPDLDARMFSFEQLARIAAEDPRARQQIQEWSRQADGSELAWTARLLERELERAPRLGLRGGLWGADPFAPFAFDHFGVPPSLEDFERQFEPLLRAPWGAVPLWRQPGAQAQRSNSSQIEITPDGVKVRVTEDVDGQQKTEEYSAPSLEELYAAHPQLRERLGVDLRGADPREFDSRGWFAAPTPGRTIPGLGAQAGVRQDILGVILEELSADERAKFGLADGAGMRIGRVEPGTLAERLGLARGQILVELDGESVQTRDDVTRRIQARKPTDEVRAVVLNGIGQRSELRWRPQNLRSI